VTKEKYHKIVTVAQSLKAIQYKMSCFFLSQSSLNINIRGSCGSILWTRSNAGD